MPLADCIKKIPGLSKKDIAFLENELADGKTDEDAITGLEEYLTAQGEELVNRIEGAGMVVQREGDAEAMKMKSILNQEAEDKKWSKWRPGETSTGKINGAPEWVNNSKDPKKALAKMERELNNRLKEGLAGRMWYEESTRRVLDITNGNLVEAEMLIQLIAIYSPQANVQVNTGFAVKAWNQYKRNEPITASNNTVKDGKATAVLYEKKPFKGRKTSSFYQNLMYEMLVKNPKAMEVLSLDQELIDSLDKPATIDMWMARAFGYNSDALGDDKGSGKYSFSENYLRRITARMNKRLEPGQPRWTPHQVQAAIWTSMKARYELPITKLATNRESTRRGLSQKKGAGYERVDSTIATQQKHLKIWRKWAMKVTGVDATEMANTTAASFETFLDQMTMQIAWETLPSAATGVNLRGLPDSVLRQFHREALQIITGEDGHDQLAEMVGSPLNYVRGSVRASGESANPAYLSHLVPTKSGGFSLEEARAYAQAIQYIYMQSRVPFFRADPRALDSKAAKEEQLFRVIKTSTGRTVAKGKFDTQMDAETFAREKGEGFEVRGGKYAFAQTFRFSEEISPQGREHVLKSLKSVLGLEADYTMTAPNEVTVINFRDPETGLPEMTDQEFDLATDLFADMMGSGLVETLDFWSEGEYGQEQDFTADPEGKASLKADGLKGRSDLQAWIRDRRQEYAALLENYSGEAAAQREVEARQSDYLAQQTAYHGTGAETLEGGRLSTKYIGSDNGTGRTAQGWGLYFSSREAVAASFHGEAGTVYQVSLMPEEDEYLNWDAPVERQPENIQRIITQVTDRSIEYWAGIGFTGQNVYEMLARNLPGGPKEASLTLNKLGIKGNKFVDPNSPGWDATVNYVIFDDTNVEIIDHLSQSAVWYSALQRAAKGLQQKKGSGQQMLAMLKKQPGVKAEELDWLGIDDWLEQLPKVTKDEILDYIEQGGVQMDAVLLGKDNESINKWRPTTFAQPFVFDDGFLYYLHPDGTVNDALTGPSDMSWNSMDQFASEVGDDPALTEMMQAMMWMQYHDIMVSETTEEEAQADPDEGPAGWSFTPAFEADLFDGTNGPFETSDAAHRAAFAYAVKHVEQSGPVAGGLSSSGNVRHAQYVEPGGVNYKEMLLTLPTLNRPKAPIAATPADVIDAEQFKISMEVAEEMALNGQPYYYVNDLDNPAVPFIIRVDNSAEYDDYKNEVADGNAYFTTRNPQGLAQPTGYIAGYTGYVVVPTEDVAQQMNEIMASAIEQEGYDIQEFLRMGEGVDYGWDDVSGTYDFENVPLWLFEAMDEGRRQLGLGIFENLVQPQADTDAPVVPRGTSMAQEQVYRGGHYDQDNVLAHIRFNDRTVDGKKVMFVEEIQSDWHQQGRKRGYQGVPATPYIVKKLMIEEFGREGREQYQMWGPLLVDYFNKAPGLRADLVVDGGWSQENVDRLERMADKYKIGSHVPDAPFKKTWPLLAMKRIIRYAAENGYDQVSWTSGMMQAQRYNLAQAVDKLEVFPVNEGAAYRVVGTRGGRSVVDKDIDSDELADNIGEELAEKVFLGPEGAEKQQKELGKELQKQDNAFNKAVDPYQPTGLNKNTYRLTVFTSIRDRDARSGNKPFSLRSMPDAEYTDLIELVEQRDETFLKWASVEEGAVIIEGIDLEVGGKGMIGFYDKMLPSLTNKYIKKMGAKVELTNFRDPRMILVPAPQADYVPTTVTDPRVNQMPTEDLRTMLQWNDRNGEYDLASRADLMESYAFNEAEDPGGQSLYDFYVEREGYTLPGRQEFAQFPQPVDGNLQREAYVSVEMESQLNVLLEQHLLRQGDKAAEINDLFYDDGLLMEDELDNGIDWDEVDTQEQRDALIPELREKIIDAYMERLENAYGVSGEVPESIARFNEPAAAPAQLPAPAQRSAPVTAQRDAFVALGEEARTNDGALNRFIEALDEHYGTNLEESLDVQEAETLDEAVDAAWGIVSQEPRYADEQDAMQLEPVLDPLVAQINALSRGAYDFEDGSEEQINAENDLFALTANEFGIEWDNEEHGNYLIRASTDERIDYVLHTIEPLLIARLQPQQQPALPAPRDANIEPPIHVMEEDEVREEVLSFMNGDRNIEEVNDALGAFMMTDDNWEDFIPEQTALDDEARHEANVQQAVDTIMTWAENTPNPRWVLGGAPVRMSAEDAAPIIGTDPGDIGYNWVMMFPSGAYYSLTPEGAYHAMVIQEELMTTDQMEVEAWLAKEMQDLTGEQQLALLPQAALPAPIAFGPAAAQARWQTYTIEGLAIEFQTWLQQHELPDASADELQGLTAQQNEERNAFIERWEEAQAREDNSNIPTRLMGIIESERGHDHVYDWENAHINPVVNDTFAVRIPVQSDIEGDWMSGTLHVNFNINPPPEDRQSSEQIALAIEVGELTTNDMSVGDWIGAPGQQQWTTDLQPMAPALPAPGAQVQVPSGEAIPQVHSFPVTDEMRKIAMDGQALFQDREDEKERGRFYPNVDGRRVIQLTEASDLSSFLHEGAHLYLDIQRIWAEKYGMNDNQKAMLKWLGARDFNSISIDQHETWAETFEVYLREGKAPSIGLRRAFSSFASWLKRIYTTLRDPRLTRASLDPEITEIFDRLLATQEEIDMAALRPEYAELFQSKEQAGMTDEQWAKYQKTAGKKKETAEMTLDEKVIKQYKAMKSREWAAEKAPIAKQEAERLAQEPIYKLLNEAQEIRDDKGRVIHDGRVDWHKMQKAIGGLPSGKLKSVGGGVDPGIYAEKYGFASVKEMDEQIRAVPNLKNAADEAAEQIMVAKHGDILKDGSLETEVREAMLNEDQAAQVIMELKAEGSANAQKIDRATLKHQAAELLGTMTYKEIRPTKFYNAMIKAAKAAAQAKDPTQDKIQQLANHYLYRAAVDAKAQMDKDRKKVRGVQARQYNPLQVDQQYIEAMKSLANAYDIRLSPQERAEYGRRVLDFYEGQTNPENENAELFGLEMLDPNLVAAIRHRHENGNLEGFMMKTFDEMTVEEMGGVTDMLEHLRYVGGQVANKGNLEAAAIREAGLKSIEENGGKDYGVQRGKQRRGKMAKLTWGDFWSSMSSLGNMVRKLDGFEDGGWAFDNIMRPIQDAIDHKFGLQLEMFKQMEDFMKKMPDAGLRKDDAETITKENGQQDDFSSEEIFMMAVYWGTDSSREALMQGHELSEVDVNTLFQKLTRPQLELVNQIWAMNESQWPKLQEAAKEMLGVAPPKLAAAPFVVNGVEMTGGHMQLMYDSQALELADESMRGMNTANVVPMRQGSTHARKGSGGRPILLDTQNITQSMEEKTHYIAFAEAGRKLRGILNNKDIQNTIEKKHGAPFYENLVHSVTAVSRAEPARETSRWLARLSRWTRQSATLMHLGYSLRNVMQQFPAALISAREVGPIKFAQATGLFGSNPMKMKREIDAKSAKMRDRANLINRDSREAMKKILATTKAEKWWHQAKSAAFVLQTAVDMSVAYPTWYAKYTDSMEKHGDEKRAIIEADQTVAETVGSGHDVYLGRIMQGNQNEFVKTLTIFGSWFNAYYQRLYKASEGGQNFLSGAFLLDAVVMPIIVANLTQMVIGDWPDEDEEWEDYVLKNSLKFMVATLPVVREAATFQEGFTPTTPISAIPAAAVRIPKEIESYLEGRQGGLKLAADIGRTVGTVMPLPGSGNLWRLFEYTESYMQGEEGKIFNPYLALTEGADKDK